jgi:hypothetical protein
VVVTEKRVGKAVVKAVNGLKAEDPAEVKVSGQKVENPAEVKVSGQTVENPAEVKVSGLKVEDPAKVSGLKAENPAEAKVSGQTKELVAANGDKDTVVGRMQHGIKEELQVIQAAVCEKVDVQIRQMSF